MQAPNLYDSEAIPAEALSEIERMFQKGDLFRYGSEASPVALLEQEFADLLGCRYALAVASCSAALFLSLKALNLPRGARVLIPAFTFAAVPSAVVHADCTPVLVEVGDNYRIDLEDFRTKLDGSIMAVLISHMRGHTSDMDAILSMAKTAGIPVIEDAAHSLGTKWNGHNIGTLGDIGCYSFQSYKMLNAGEGGILITDNANLVARAVIMSGAYEHNWKKHPVLQDQFSKWQNTLPLYNTRMSNLSAAVIRPQLPALEQRVIDGRNGYNYVAKRINELPCISVPPALSAELRAPDSIQFNLVDMSDEDVANFLKHTADRGVPVQVFGRSKDNARAFWNWKFLGDLPELPQTRSMLMRACDVRLPARLSKKDLTFVADTIITAAQQTKELPVN
ncbi:MAG: DegT/DnrJ/EryC1/StrS aminotransferase family protein [Pseudoruegeria sp.]